MSVLKELPSYFEEIEKVSEDISIEIIDIEELINYDKIFFHIKNNKIFVDYDEIVDLIQEENLRTLKIKIICDSNSIEINYENKIIPLSLDDWDKIHDSDLEYYICNSSNKKVYETDLFVLEDKLTYHYNLFTKIFDVVNDNICIDRYNINTKEKIIFDIYNEKFVVSYR